MSDEERRCIVCGFGRSSPRHGPVEDCRMRPRCDKPQDHHPFKEEPMPEPRVTIGTVLSFFEPDDMDNRENGAKPNVTLQFSRGDRLPRIGDRVAVAHSVDAIFGWMESLPAARVIEAAKAWAAMVDGLPHGTRPPRYDSRVQSLYDAVKALGETPSEESPVEAYEPPIIRDRKARGVTPRLTGIKVSGAGVTVTLSYTLTSEEDA